MVSCIEGDDFSDVLLSDDAELLTFGLSNDSIPELANVVFTIDQRTGLIYNHDSMTYNTSIDTVVTVSYTNTSNVTNVLLILPAGDSIRWIASGDTLNVSNPFYFKVYSQDGSKTKIYKGQVNIHQVDPDSIQYIQITENEPFLNNENFKALNFKGTYYIYTRKNEAVYLYESIDAKVWTEMGQGFIPNDLVISGIQAGESTIYGYTESGDFYISEDAFQWNKINTEYRIRSILGFLPESPVHKSGLSLIAEKENEYVFAFFTHDSNKPSEWRYGSEKIADNFPVSGFSVINYAEEEVQCLTVIGGISNSKTPLNTVWALKDSLHWTKISEDRFPESQNNKIPKIEGANAFLYDNEFYLVNGRLDDASYNNKVYYSTNRGFSWKVKPDKCLPPSNYILRKNASLIMDNKGVVFYIIGGQENTILTDIWHVFLNKKTFAE
ncbi:MAG: DUF6242 domain-containing protein [Dysgonamonadaceae bacterium]|nr:DUF6242 domain-containing protein [Dysgonamonadaceae bacterium]